MTPPGMLFCMPALPVLLAACAPAAPSYGAAPPDLVTADPNATATATPFQPGATLDAIVQDIVLTEVAGWTDTPTPTASSTPEPPTATPANTAVLASAAPPSNSASRRLAHSLHPLP